MNMNQDPQASMPQAQPEAGLSKLETALGGALALIMGGAALGGAYAYGNKHSADKQSVVASDTTGADTRDLLGGTPSTTILTISGDMVAAAQPNTDATLRAGNFKCGGERDATNMTDFAYK